MSKEPFRPSVRYVNGITIWFKDKLDIVVFDDSRAIKISRWASNQKGCYQNQWKPFCEKLYRLNSIKSLWEVTYIANNYDLDVYSVSRSNQVIPDGIMVRPSKYLPQRKTNKE